MKCETVTCWTCPPSGCAHIQYFSHPWSETTAHPQTPKKGQRVTCSHCCFVASLKVFKRDWIHQESIQTHLNEFRGGIAAFELLKQGEHFVAAGCEESPKKKRNVPLRVIENYLDPFTSFLFWKAAKYPSIASTRELNCEVLQYDQNEIKLTWYYLCPCCQQKSSRLPGLADAWSAKYEW